VEKGAAATPDAAVLLFRSSAAGLNALGGLENGGSAQYYLYDDRDRSLLCASCPQDGAAPAGAVPEQVAVFENLPELGLTPLSEDGRTLAFATPTALLNADQNTPAGGGSAGTDVYEWRDGRLLLVTDGLTNWPGGSGGQPKVEGSSPSGRDIYFSAAAQYTADALDGYRRLYDARIGGGFEFPVPPRPCALEACQGTPKGAPAEALPGSASFAGPGNEKPAKHKAKKHKKKKHKKKHHKGKHKRDHDRRAPR
jgi:hypothetical protein